MSSYKGHQITETSTTCGNNYAHVYKIEGPHGKPACQRPFLTSAAACKRHINERLHWASRTGLAAHEEMSRELKAEQDAYFASAAGQVEHADNLSQSMREWFGNE